MSSKIQLANLSKMLLRLHKVLIEAERYEFEAENGAIRSPGEFLNILMSHDQFQWLRLMSQMIARIDELVDDDDQTSDRDIESFKKEVEELLFPMNPSDFSTKYQKHLISDTSVLMVNSELRALLKNVN